MPVKKGKRSATSTKATSKAASKLDVFDENAVSSSPVQINNAKTLTSKSKKTSAKVLKESSNTNTANRDLGNSAIESSPQKTQPAVPTNKKNVKGKKAKSTFAATNSAAAESQSSDSSFPPGKRLPEEQIQAFLRNYDLEAQARLSRLRASLEMSVQSAMTRMKLTLERMPRAIRELTLAEFIDDYDADVHVFMGRAPVQRFEDGQKEWQDALQQSPAKTKRVQATRSDEERGLKSARRTNNTARASTSAAPTKSAAAKKASNRSTATSMRSAITSTASPAGSATSSSMPAPSLATFNPDIPRQAAQTPKPRMARPGELLQWQSVNGSPICGIIGNDGIIRPVSLASS